MVLRVRGMNLVPFDKERFRKNIHYEKVASEVDTTAEQRLIMLGREDLNELLQRNLTWLQGDWKEASISQIDCPKDDRGEFHLSSKEGEVPFHRSIFTLW